MKKFYISDLSLSSLDLPLRLPFVTALGEKKISRNLAVNVALSPFFVGYGEASESLAMPSQTQRKMANALERIRERLVGKEVQDTKSLHRLCRLAWQMEPEYPTAVAAFECALFDAYCKSQGMTLWQFFGSKKESLQTSYTLSTWPSTLAAKVAREIYQVGFRQFKVKVSGNIEEDMIRIRAVFESTPHAPIGIDANQAFSPNQALQFLKAIKPLKISPLFFEQPLKKDDWEGLAELRAKSRIPIAVDESLQTTADARRIVKKNLADIFNIKLAKSGIIGALEIMKVAKRHRKKLMIGCMAESAKGLWPSVALACGSGAFDYVDLDSHLLVESPSESLSFTTQGDRLRILH